MDQKKFNEKTVNILSVQTRVSQIILQSLLKHGDIMLVTNKTNGEVIIMEVEQK